MCWIKWVFPASLSPTSSANGQMLNVNSAKSSSKFFPTHQQHRPSWDNFRLAPFPPWRSHRTSQFQSQTFLLCSWNLSTSARLWLSSLWSSQRLFFWFPRFCATLLGPFQADLCRTGKALLPSRFHVLSARWARILATEDPVMKVCFAPSLFTVNCWDLPESTQNFKLREIQSSSTSSSQRQS